MSERILVIDDHSETLRLIRLILQRQGYEVDTAQSGQEGIDQALSKLPDLVLLDIMMPGMNGLEVCQHFRQENALTSVPIVMFTARSQIEDKTEAFEAGANDYIVKPTRPQELVERVQASLAKYAVAAPIANNQDVSDEKANLLIGLINATDDEMATEIAYNLAAYIGNNHHPVYLANPRGLKPSREISGVDIQDDVNSAEKLQHLQKKRPTLTVLGSQMTDEVVAILPTLTHLVICVAPELMSISSAQKHLEVAKVHLSAENQIHALLVAKSNAISVPVETASSFLQYPISQTIVINEKEQEKAKEDLLPIICLFPKSEMADQIQAFISHLIA